MLYLCFVSSFLLPSVAPFVVVTSPIPGNLHSGVYLGCHLPNVLATAWPMSAVSPIGLGTCSLRVSEPPPGQLSSFDLLHDRP
jgi:hypothetical protein